MVCDFWTDELCFRDFAIINDKAKEKYFDQYFMLPSSIRQYKFHVVSVVEGVICINSIRGGDEHV
ncbi:uncharacterized protein G2W53_022198 [Senna tora]|uniref:Uncharacterized protein n=1 Tax=Senna tora TaxID=362788 RepID=A0A834TU14_9FABA|nr:uncharacterized protein G2W53_022198 [Senna tora]